MYLASMLRDEPHQQEKTLIFMMFMELVMDIQKMMILITALLVWIQETFKDTSINQRLKQNYMLQKISGLHVARMSLTHFNLTKMVVNSFWLNLPKRI